MSTPRRPGPKRKYNIGNKYYSPTKGELFIEDREPTEMFCILNGEKVVKPLGSFHAYIKTHNFNLVE